MRRPSRSTVSKASHARRADTADRYAGQGAAHVAGVADVTPSGDAFRLRALLWRIDMIPQDG